MKPKITRAGLLNDLGKDFVANSISGSGAVGSLPTQNQIKFTDLYLSDSLGDNRPVRAKSEIGRPDIENLFTVINFRIAILRFKGFFKGFQLFIGYTNVNGSIFEKHYSINDTLRVVADLKLNDIKDLTQVCISVRSDRGTPLDISMSAEGLGAAHELKIDITALNDITLFVDDLSKDQNETQRPLGWISYNAPNIFY